MVFFRFSEISLTPHTMTGIMAQHIYLNHLQLFYGRLLSQFTVLEGCWAGSQLDTGPINGEGQYYHVNQLRVRDAGWSLRWTLGQ